VTGWAGSTAVAANGATPAAVPFTRLDRDDPELLAELLEVVARVAGEAAFTLGPEVEEFEREFAAFCETVHAVGVSSGTAALELALRGLGIGPGDEVIVPANSFVATAEAVTATGAMPRLVDVDEATALLTAETVQPALTEYTRCLIPVHLYGRTVDMDPLLALARRRGILVVEDACQAHGARYRGRPVGSLGDAGCFSFYPSKNLGAWGDGGAVVTRSSRLADRVRLLRSHGEAPRHNHRIRAGTDRLDGLQAALLRVKLGRLADANRRRREAGDLLRQALVAGPAIPPSATSDDGDHVFHLFVVRALARDQLREHLGANDIASGIHYPKPIHLQPAYAGLGLPPGSLPVAERLALESCSLPFFPGIEEHEIDRVAATVASFSPRPSRGLRRAGSPAGS
jgi:dTDP-4-amino-4,6-dideoxygalactose transaminase